VRYKYRVTKYNPEFRDANGHYLRSEWTEHADIGEVFGGVRLEDEEYLRVEALYLAATRYFLEEARIPGLVLKDLQVWFEDLEAEGLGFLKNGATLSVEQCLAFQRALLRHEAFGALSIPGRAYLHVGFDFYVYIGLPVPCLSAVQAVERSGLFVEPFRSPHLRAPPGYHTRRVVGT